MKKLVMICALFMFSAPVFADCGGFRVFKGGERIQNTRERVRERSRNVVVFVGKILPRNR